MRRKMALLAVFSLGLHAQIKINVPAARNFAASGNNAAVATPPTVNYQVSERGTVYSYLVTPNDSRGIGSVTVPGVLGPYIQIASAPLSDGTSPFVAFGTSLLFTGGLPLDGQADPGLYLGSGQIPFTVRSANLAPSVISVCTIYPADTTGIDPNREIEDQFDAFRIVYLSSFGCTPAIGPAINVAGGPVNVGLAILSAGLQDDVPDFRFLRSLPPFRAMVGALGYTYASKAPLPRLDEFLFDPAGEAASVVELSPKPKTPRGVRRAALLDGLGTRSITLAQFAQMVQDVIDMGRIQPGLTPLAADGIDGWQTALYRSKAAVGIY